MSRFDTMLSPVKRLIDYGTKSDRPRIWKEGVSSKYLTWVKYDETAVVSICVFNDVC